MPKYHGIVKDQNGNPIEGAKVAHYCLHVPPDGCPYFGSEAYVTLADGTWWFFINGPREQRHMIASTKDGYSAEDDNTAVGEDRLVNFTLKKL